MKNSLHVDNKAVALKNWPNDVRSLRMPWYDSSCIASEQKTVGVFLHIFYPELTEELLLVVANIPIPVRIYISTDTEEKQAFIAKALDKAGFADKYEIQVLPNRGWDIAPFLIGYADRIREHEIILRLHGKRSGHLSEEKSAEWRTLLFSSLAGSPERVRSILAAFDRCQSLGMVCPEHWYVILPFVNAEVDCEDMNRLLAPFDCSIASADPIDFPSGSMFWCRSKALEPLLSQNFRWEDFDPTDGEKRWNTLAHAIERTFFFMCGFAGLQWSRVPQLSALGGPMPSPEYPGVSVILTSYNYARYIGITITSVLSQTWKNLELIIIDDGSTDASVSLIESFARDDSRITLLRHANGGNHGLATSLRHAMEHTKHELVAFIESDDYWHEKYLETHIKSMRNHNADVTYCHPICVAQPGGQSRLRDFEEYILFCGESVPFQDHATSLRETLCHRNVIPTMSCLVAKRSLFNNCNWDSPVSAWSDWWLWMQISDQKFFRIPAEYAFWRIHAKSYHSEQKQTEEIQVMYTAMRVAHAALESEAKSKKKSSR